MKKTHTILIAVFSIVFTLNVQAQEKRISGVVTSKSDGTSLPGVSIVVQGTTRGTETDFDGKYTIKTSVGEMLSFSFLGMKSKTVVVGNSNTINVDLEDDADQLDEIIVTALGIKKERKTLTYSAQDVKGDDLTRVKQTNPINSLSGKSAGLTITRSSSGAGGAVKVVLRGNSSTSNNDPLYVIDGIPMQNSGNGQNGEAPGTNIFGSQTGNRDGGDITSLINPDDVESMTILKGASAAALYGSQGANGVILITTKRGKEGKIKVNFNSTLMSESVMSLPELQSEYQSVSVGQGVAENGNLIGGPKSWGAKTSGLSNDVKSFFRAGHTATQSISLSAGTQKAQTYLSYANTLAKGVIPNNSMVRNNFNLRETASFLDDKISVSASINLSDQRINNRPTNGLYSNPLTGLYLHPVGIDRNIYKNKFEYFNTTSNMMDQYESSKFSENIQQNPYWLINRNMSKDVTQRVLASISAKYQVTENLSLQSRGSFDKSFFTFDKRLHAGSDLTFVPTTGRYINEKTENTQQYIDLIANYSKDLSEDFNLGVILGTSLTKYKTGDQTLLDSGSEGLRFPNEFTIANFNSSNGISQKVSNREVQSLFGAANFGYKNMLFLDITGRTDWSSTLINTASSSFFYPSIGLTNVLSEMFEMPESISFAKVRVSYAEVGKDIPAYATIPLRSIGTTGSPDQATFAPINGETLEPEEQKSFEIGTEWRFFGNRLGLDLTYYSSSTKNQIFFIAAEPNVEGYTQNIVNAGEITNKGIELIINGKPIVNDNFKWNTALNFASNKNKVVSVHPSLQDNKAILTAHGVNGYEYSLIEGEDFGSILGQSVKRNANGLPIVTATPDPDPRKPDVLTIEATGYETIAHAQPDFTLGWSNTFDFKNFSINFLIDGKFGGDVVSVTEAVNDFYGVSQATADARNTNGGMVNVVTTDGAATQMTAQEYYSKTAHRNGLLGEYVYDATNVSLRELSVGYNLPKVAKYFESIKLSLIANNLFFIYKDAPFDPNIASSTGTGLQGVDIYGQPSTRSIGLNININF